MCMCVLAPILDLPHRRLPTPRRDPLCFAPAARQVKIYFLRRRLFFAALSYGKERTMAQVVRPSTDPEVILRLATPTANHSR